MAEQQDESSLIKLIRERALSGEFFFILSAGPCRTVSAELVQLRLRSRGDGMEIVLLTATGIGDMSVAMLPRTACSADEMDSLLAEIHGAPLDAASPTPWISVDQNSIPHEHTSNVRTWMESIMRTPQQLQ